MISRFFKRKPKESEKKTATKKAEKTVTEKPKAKVGPFQKLLTAEGWKRMMMRRARKAKK